MTAQDLGKQLAGNNYDAARMYFESKDPIYQKQIVPDCEGALFRVGRHLWSVTIKDGLLVKSQQLTVPGS